MKKKTAGRSSLDDFRTEDKHSESSHSRLHGDKRARSRRLVLKSIVTGGAVATSAKSLPEKWTRPITDSVMMPAHAQSSPMASLACRVGNFSSVPEAQDEPIIDPALPVSGGTSVNISSLADGSGDSDLDTGDIEIALGGISATLDPAGAGDVTLTMSAGGDFDLDVSATQDVTPNASGVADFPSINGDLTRAVGDSASDTPPSDTTDQASIGNLELRFSAPGTEDCVIQFTFTELLFGTTV